MPSDLTTKNHLKILTQNIRSITKNVSQFEVLLSRLQISCEILILTESWNSKATYIPCLKNYETHYTKNNRNQNDGIVAYTREGLSCSVAEIPLTDATCLVIQIDSDTVVIGIYRSPSFSNIDNFITSLDSLLNTYRNRNNVIIMGDLNIDVKLNNEDRNSTDYLNLLASHGFLPGHLYPTRENNCIDHAMVKTNFSTTTLVLQSLLTDHSPVLSCVTLQCPIKPLKQMTINKVNYEAILADLNSVNFSNIMESHDAHWSSAQLLNILNTSIMNNTLKLLTPRRLRCIKPWITPGLVRCIRNRDRMHIRSKLEPNNVTLTITYSRYKNFCNDLLKRLKRNFLANELNKNAKNPKMTWKIINNITNRDTKKPPPLDLLKTKNTPELALEEINLYFTNIAQQLASKIIPCSDQIEESFSPPVNSMVMLEATEEEVESIIINLKTDSAMGWDGISTKIIKMTRNIIVPLLTRIANLSIRTGVFPNVFKISVVHPIHKAGSRDCVSNYRPISVLPVLSKILEKIFNKRLLLYLEKQQIIAHNQFGFRAGRSTAQAVTELTNLVAHHIDSKNKCIGVFLDLAKAFDTVSVPILINKMERIGIRGKVLDLFKDYLNNRSQRVTIDGIYSPDAQVSFGVPQGSVLGPTLFLIYINCLCSLTIQNCRIFTFADDTALIFYGSTWDEVRQYAEIGLHKTAKWLSQNLLTLNISKTKFITFANTEKSLKPAQNLKIKIHSCQSTDHQYTCDCGYLDRVKTVKYLGILLDEKFTWCPYIDLLAGRTRKLIYVFKKLRHVADIGLRKNVYFVLAQSILAYCITSWGGARKTHLIKLERAQRALLKVMNFKHFRYPTADLYSECDVLTIRQLFVKETVLLQHQKLKFIDTPTVASRRIDRVCPTVAYKTAFIEKFQCYLGPMLYNKLNKIIKMYPLNQHSCKKVLISWLKSQSYESVENLFAILK